MGRDWISEADAPAALQMRAFAEGIAASPGVYMLSPADAQTISAAVERYVQALSAARAPETRSKPIVLSKSQARHDAQELCRQYARLIKYNAGISDEDKVAIGVPPPHNNRSKRHAPSTSPALGIIAATPGAHTLSFKDSITGGRRMPFGAVNLQVFVAIGDEQIRDPEQARLCACVTKSPFVIAHEHKDARKIATYFARWASQRGEFGPWSAPMSMVIAA